jgi:hypothetical protein
MSALIMDASWCAGLPKLRSQKAYEFQAIYVLPAEVKSGRPVCVSADDVYHQLPKVLWKQGLDVTLALQDIPPVEVPKMNIRSFFEVCLEAASQSREFIEEFQPHTGTWERVLAEAALNTPPPAAGKATPPVPPSPRAAPSPPSTPRAMASPPAAIGPIESPSPTAAARATLPPMAAPSLRAEPSLHNVMEPPATISPRAAPPTAKCLKGAVPERTNAPHIHHDAGYNKGLLTRRQLARKRQQERRRTNKMLP